MAKQPSIYKIQSKVHPDRCYVGSAIQLKSRWALHKADLHKNKHHSSKLQNHYNKYGLDDLIFIIIEPCLPEFLVIREQYYLDTLKPFFNISPTASSRLGVKASKETRDKISKAKKGKPGWGKRREKREDVRNILQTAFRIYERQ